MLVGCWTSILLNHAKAGKTVSYVADKIALLERRGKVTSSDKVEIYAAMLQGGIFQESELDTYVANGWITELEKGEIINAPITQS